MSAIIYDSRRIFWPANAPAKAIPIDIKSSGAIGDATNVQDAIQLLTNDISGVIEELPKELDETSATLNDTIKNVNAIINALKNFTVVDNKQ